MPSKSEKQKKFMRSVCKKVEIAQEVACDFENEDKKAQSGLSKELKEMIIGVLD